MLSSCRVRGPVVLCLLLFLAPVQAEIYKWVDADGNVHFGDKPQDAAKAAQAEPVEIRESYQPTKRSTQEQEVYDKEQRELQRVSDARRQEREGKLAEERAERSLQKEKICAAYAEDIRSLTTLDTTTNNIPTYYYATDEDGKSVTSQRQREIVEELKAASAAAGCS